MNLGSIAHLQYYFARTGLLDGKGGQLAKKKESELLAEKTCSITGNAVAGGRGDFSTSNSAFTSSRNSPDFGPMDMAQSPMGISPGITGQEEYFYSDDEDEDSIVMLPPTVSTYNDRPKPTPRLPTHQEYKDNLRKCLQDAARSLAEAKAAAPVCPDSPAARHLRSPSKFNEKALEEIRKERLRSESNATLLSGEGEMPEILQNQGWYEVQGVHILDVVTLAIRAARQYYTAHPNPLRLNSIKSERRIRAELLSVMEVLRRMATRNFSKGMRREEVETMEKWVSGCWDMLSEEEGIEKRELEERRTWTWLEDSQWPPSTADDEPNTSRELAFLRSLDPTTDSPLPDDLASNFDAAPVEPSPFLLQLQSGLRLVQLHNAMVAKSKRPFGAIPTFHTDVRKPYRMAENLRYWIKAAELRWEIILKVDVMGVVNGLAEGGDPNAWKNFETAIFRWARQVRVELTNDLNLDERPTTALPIKEVVKRDREVSRDRTHIVVNEPEVVG